MWRSLRCERESATSWRANFALGVVAAARGEAFLLRRGDGDRETLDIVLASLLEKRGETSLLKSLEEMQGSYKEQEITILYENVQ